MKDKIKDFYTKKYKLFYKLMGNGDNKNKIEKRLYSIFIIALSIMTIIFFIEVISIFLIKLSAFIEDFFRIDSTDRILTMGVKDTLEILGPFGDFFGGMLNPILTFCSFMALLMTIVLQQKELKLTREELEETRKATRDSAEALQEQSHSIKLQNFENTFFNMLNLHREIINNLLLKCLKKHWIYNGNSHWAGTKESIPIEQRKYLYTILNQQINIEEDDDFYGKKVISKLFEILNCYIKNAEVKNINTLYDNFYKEYNEIIGHYFRNIYHILKYIKKTSEKKQIDIDSKFYTNILRAQLSNSELALLLLNALSKYGKDELFPLLIEYEFMEPLPISIIDKSYLNILLDLCDNKKIFGKNEDWLK